MLCISGFEDDVRFSYALWHIISMLITRQWLHLCRPKVTTSQ